MSIFTVVARGHYTSVVMGNLLETVADAEKGHLLLFDELPQFLRNVGSILLINTRRTA